jgi:hypothetical protein
MQVAMKCCHWRPSGCTIILRDHLKRHLQLAHQRVVFEGADYFRNPTPLEFVAENPPRHFANNIADTTKVILDARVRMTGFRVCLLKS